MGEEKKIRLSKAAREFNVGLSTIIGFLHKKGFDLDLNPNSKISGEIYEILANEYSSEARVKKESEKVKLHTREPQKSSISINDIASEKKIEEESDEEELIIQDHSAEKEDTFKTTTEAEVKKEEPIAKLKVVGKIDLEEKKKNKPTAKKETKEKEKKKNKPSAKKKEEKAKPEEEIKKEKSAEVPVPEKTSKEEPPAVSIPEEESAKETEAKATEPVQEKKKTAEDADLYKSKVEQLAGPTVVGKINLPVEEPKKKPVASSKAPVAGNRKKRKRIRKNKEKVNLSGDKGRKDVKKGGKKSRYPQHEVNEEDVQKQIKETLARLTSKTKSKASKYRREKRAAISHKQQEEIQKLNDEKNVLKVTEFVSVNEMANMMDVPVTDVISTCMNLGLIVSINQRLDAETMSLVADEFGYDVEFVSADIIDTVKETEDRVEDLVHRPPIVTVMGHVDHGKTKLLDYIRNTNVVAGEAGGITQHIGAYAVSLKDGQKITFLDTPGHEAFTAMRARGAQITDIAVIVVAADDGIMPQTVEAINHAQAAGVPIVFAINKIDKPDANPEKIKEELANMNILVEDWGGKYQSQDISAKQGLNVDLLLEKILLEAEMLELKANPHKHASGTVIESSLDKGRGYIATILVKEGTLKMGDIVLAGIHYGHVKALFNERGKKIEEAGPSMPALILGLNGAPQAGDKFNVMESDKEAKEIALKRSQLQREQGLRAQKHITLDEIGRRIAIGNFQELNVVIKGDVDGSVEVLSDALTKLSTEEIQVNVIHKAVGQITESDILLAAASNAIVIGFQVRPSANARKLAEKEEIDIRLYSIIYDAIEELKAAMEGMLTPEIKEEITGTLQVREIFKINKVGTIAGCVVTEGKIFRKSKIHVIRDGIVIYTGELESLKRFKEDVKEVVSGQDCGLNIQNFNDIKVGDTIEAFEETEIKKTL
ncbi:MAG: translation initiation factor IF-2 [Bacteroidales bacterium]|nr:translation initiation factor IF-2 [Bacteroidales bacterium]